MVDQEERTGVAELGKATRQAEASLATSEPWDPAVTNGLRSYPPADQWDNWLELDPMAWPEQTERRIASVGPASSIPSDEGTTARYMPRIILPNYC